jgi:hypothetical protein
MSATENIKSVPTQDYDEVIAAVSKDDEGLRFGTWETITEAFDDDAIMYGWTGDQLSAGPAYDCAPHDSRVLRIAARRPAAALES